MKIKYFRYNSKCIFKILHCLLQSFSFTNSCYRLNHYTNYKFCDMNKYFIKQLNNRIESWEVPLTQLIIQYYTIHNLPAWADIDHFLVRNNVIAFAITYFTGKTSRFVIIAIEDFLCITLYFNVHDERKITVYCDNRNAII